MVAHLAAQIAMVGETHLKRHFLNRTGRNLRDNRVLTVFRNNEVIAEPSLTEFGNEKTVVVISDSHYNADAGTLYQIINGDNRQTAVFEALFFGTGDGIALNGDAAHIEEFKQRFLPLSRAADVQMLILDTELK
jgi:hypothetical protein